MMPKTDTVAWVLNVIKMKKLIERWKSSSRSYYLCAPISDATWLQLCVQVRGHKFRIGNILSLLREVETQDMVRSLLRDWQIRTLKDYVFEYSGVSNDENYVPIRPTEKKKRKNYRCGHCGVENDHYITTCPKKASQRREKKLKKLGYVRNPKTGKLRLPLSTDSYLY